MHFCMKRLMKETLFLGHLSITGHFLRYYNKLNSLESTAANHHFTTLFRAIATATVIYFIYYEFLSVVELHKDGFY